MYTSEKFKSLHTETKLRSIQNNLQKKKNPPKVFYGKKQYQSGCLLIFARLSVSLLDTPCSTQWVSERTHHLASPGWCRDDPEWQQKKAECPCSSRRVGLCLGVGAVCLRGASGGQGVRAQAEAEPEGSHCTGFARSSAVCTWYDIKLFFSRYRMHRHCKRGRKDKDEHHRSWRGGGRNLCCLVYQETEFHWDTIPNYKRIILLPFQLQRQLFSFPGEALLC